MSTNQPFAYLHGRTQSSSGPAPPPESAPPTRPSPAPTRYTPQYYSPHPGPPHQRRPSPSSNHSGNNNASHPPQQPPSQPMPRPISSRIGPVRPTGERQRLYTDKHERERFDDMAAIFSLLTATERLENMWARRGAIPQQDYEMQCDRLIKQYKTLAATGNAVPDLRRFIAEYDCKANLAYARLEEGVPATVIGQNKNVYKYVMNCTSMFHHLSDTIVMEQTGVDVLLPELTTLNRYLETIKRMAPHSNYDFNQKINAWTQRLNEMPAHKKLSTEDAAQLKLDLDTSFQEFERAFND